MKQCIALGKEAMSKGNPPVGSIIVRNDTVIGIGLEAGKSSKDITKHAEIEAVKDAIQNNHLEDLKDCKLYTTHEPCIMCSYVLRQYKIDAIIYGSNVDHVGGITSSLNVMTTKHVPNWEKPPNILGDILKEECDNLTASYKLYIKNNNEK
jgi:tRNA(Arg) A34 adenosine deaminase TadA